MMVSGHRVYPTSSRYLITERHESAVAFIGCDAAASNSADVPLRTRRWPPPVVGSDCPRRLKNDPVSPPEF
jgi:hypothetical protein